MGNVTVNKITQGYTGFDGATEWLEYDESIVNMIKTVGDEHAT